LLHNIPKDDVPFSTIHIDHFYPLPKTQQRFQYIFKVIDAFTKCIKLYPCRSTDAKEVIKHLSHYFQDYSRPLRIISDRGSAFRSDAFKEFVSENNVQHVLSATGTPLANGQIERSNRDLTPMFSKTVSEPNKWDHALAAVEFAINNTVNRSTKETPSKLLFGINQRRPIEDTLRDYLESELLLLLFGMLVNRLYTQTKTNSKQRYTMQQLKKRLCTRYGKRSIKPLKCR
jgi:hypothetical protein